MKGFRGWFCVSLRAKDSSLMQQHNKAQLCRMSCTSNKLEYQYNASNLLMSILITNSPNLQILRVLTVNIRTMTTELSRPPLPKRVQPIPTPTMKQEMQLQLQAVLMVLILSNPMYHITIQQKAEQPILLQQPIRMARVQQKFMIQRQVLCRIQPIPKE